MKLNGIKLMQLLKWRKNWQVKRRIERKWREYNTNYPYIGEARLGHGITVYELVEQANEQRKHSLRKRNERDPLNAAQLSEWKRQLFTRQMKLHPFNLSSKSMNTLIDDVWIWHNPNNINVLDIPGWEEDEE